VGAEEEEGEGDEMRAGVVGESSSVGGGTQKFILVVKIHVGGEREQERQRPA